MVPSYRPFIIPVFLPNIGCPHRCVFCDQTAITGVKQNIPSPGKLRLMINEFLKYRGKHRNTVQVSFYGGNFLGLKKDHIQSLLHEATKFVAEGKIDSIRFSTRPDTIDNEMLDFLKDFPVSTVEIGVQSMDDQVLAMIRRGHTSSDTEKAVGLLKERNYEIGLQMMVGLPHDDEIRSIYTGRRIAALSPDFVRIYPTVVLKNSLLAKWYEKREYTPLPLEPCVALVKKLYILFRKSDIPVVRMGLQTSKDLENKTAILAGPYHPAFGHLVYSEIFLDMATSLLKAEKTFNDTIYLKVHPRSISKMKGPKNRNIEILKKQFHIRTLKIIPDPAISEDRLTVLS